MAADGDEPVQIKVHKSLRLWAFYVDLEEGLGTLESTRAVYERILDLRIATPQIIINYAWLLEVWTFLKKIAVMKLSFNCYLYWLEWTNVNCTGLYRNINTLKMHSRYMKGESKYSSILT